MLHLVPVPDDEHLAPPDPPTSTDPPPTSIAGLVATDALDERDRRAIGALVVRAATGLRIDRDADWTADALRRIGCGADLAADVEAIMTTAPPPARAARPPEHHDDRPPSTPSPLAAPIALPSPAIEGLSPVGSCSADDRGAAPVRHGWRRWATAGRGRRRRGRAN